MEVYHESEQHNSNQIGTGESEWEQYRSPGKAALKNQEAGFCGDPWSSVFRLDADQLFPAFCAGFPEIRYSRAPRALCRFLPGTACRF